MSSGVRAVIGVVAWLVLALPMVPDARHGAWAEALVMLAALVMAPLLLEIVQCAEGRSLLAGDVRRADTEIACQQAPILPVMRDLLRWAARLQLPAGLLLVGAFRLEQGAGAALCAAPWALVLLLVASAGGLGLMRGGLRSAPEVCRNAGLVFAAVGAAWLLADRFGLRPLGFDPQIVLLTAIHFHYAGLILPVLAAEALERLECPWVTAGIVGGVIAGVPAVAVGITLAQLDLGHGVERAAALLMAASGSAVAWVHLVLAMQPRWTVAARCWWAVAGCLLGAGMLLAALYALRGVWAPWPWLDIPWMRALHGTLNSFGFAGCGSIGWWYFQRKAKHLTTDQTWSGLKR